MALLQYKESSNNILVYPSSNRVFSESAKITEYRFSRQIIQLLQNNNMDGFVVSNSISEITGGQFIFVLAGHVFIIDDISNLLNAFVDKKKIYAQVRLREISSSMEKLDYYVLDNYSLSDTIDTFDVATQTYTEFHGVRFSVDKLDAKGDSKELLILENKSGKWYIPGESKILLVPGFDFDDTYVGALLAVGKDGLYWDKDAVEGENE